MKLYFVGLVALCCLFRSAHPVLVVVPILPAQHNHDESRWHVSCTHLQCIVTGAYDRHDPDSVGVDVHDGVQRAPRQCQHGARVAATTQVSQHLQIQHECEFQAGDNVVVHTGCLAEHVPARLSQ